MQVLAVRRDAVEEVGVGFGATAVGLPQSPPSGHGGPSRGGRGLRGIALWGCFSSTVHEGGASNAQSAGGRGFAKTAGKSVG